MEGLDYWRLCDELSLIQAALLIVGVDPAESQEYVDEWSADNRPKGYDAAKAALIHAIKGDRLKATWRSRHQNGYGEDIPDWHLTTILVHDLRAWLTTRGIKSGFFFPTQPVGPEYLNPSGPHYSPKLAAAVEAWTAVSADSDLRRGKSVKKALEIWLRQNGIKFSLTKDDGNPNEQGIEEVAKVANWDTSGGAPKTPGK